MGACQCGRRDGATSLAPHRDPLLSRWSSRMQSVDIDVAKEAGVPDAFCRGMLVMADFAQMLTDAIRPTVIRAFFHDLAWVVPCEDPIKLVDRYWQTTREDRTSCQD
jgi:hypothetical protein